MRKLLLLFMICLLISFTGCSDENSRLQAVLDNETTFINEEGKDVFLSEYEYADKRLAVAAKYAFLDLDEDLKDKLVICISEKEDWFLILHDTGAEIYGYCLYVRSFQDLKPDGSFMQSGGALDNYCARIEFSDPTYTFYYTAVSSRTGERYEIGGKPCSEEESRKFIADFTEKEPVHWQSVK